MVDSGTYSTPGLGGSIASRYLDAISCGGQDLSALTIGSSDSPWTPDRPKAKPILRKVLNDSSCGMTAPTAALETSASWSSKETPSRSDVASRRGNSGLTSQPMSADNRLATSSAIKLEIEDECSSIDSSSSHQRNRPAHVSLQMDSSCGDASFGYESFSGASSPGVPMPTRIMQKARKHLEERRRQNGTLTPNRNTATYLFACGPSANFFPKTSPRTPTNQFATNNTIPPSPHQARLTGKWKPNREGNTERWTGLNWRQQCLGEEIAESVAGAPTEVITNRTRDLLNRTTLSMPKDPPQVRRWTPSANLNVGESQLMHSLMDDASTNEDSSARISDRRLLRALFDGPSSSSLSPTQSTDASKVEAHVKKQNLGHQPLNNSLNSADSSFDNGGESNPQHAAFSKGKAVFGGREVGTGARPIRKWSPTTRSFQPTSAARPTEEQTQQPPVSPVRLFMNDDPIPQPRIPQPASSGEVTSSVSTTDNFLVPDFADGTRGTNTFVTYNARKTPNAHEVFQRRYSDSSNTSTLSTSDKEHDELFLPSRSPIQPLFSLDRLDLSDDAPSLIRKRSQSTYHAKHTVVQVPTRSKSCTDRVQRAALERIEERRQVAMNLKEVDRFKNSEAAQRFAVKKEASNQAMTPDPIFCPTGSVSPSPTLSSDKGATSRSSHEDYINVGRSAISIGDGLERNDGTSTSVNDQLQGILEASRKHDEEMSSHGSPPHNPSSGLGISPVAPETKRISGMKGRTSVVAPTRQNSSVQQIIQAFNLPPSDQGNHSHEYLHSKGNVNHTSRESLVMGARIARLLNEEKKDESHYDGHDHHDLDDVGSVRSLREKFENHQSSRVNVFIYTHNDDADASSIKSLDETFKKHEFSGNLFFGAQQDDDDTGSVRSLREKFEKQFHKGSPPRNSENDDNFSVKSLREKLERYWAKDGISDEDEDLDDEGSVRSLREKFEPPKKRESQALVSNLRSVFEPKRPAVKLPSKSRTDTKKVAAHASSNIRGIPRVVTPVGPIAPTFKSAVPDSSRESRDTAMHITDHGQDVDSQKAQIEIPRERIDISQRLTHQTIDRYIQETNTDKSAKATDASMDRDEDDTISTHSSRLREPAHTSFLSMRDRLLKFSNEQPANAITMPQKKPTPPSMHERLNRWANRHQNRNRAQVEPIGGNMSPTKAIEDTKVSQQAPQRTKPSLGETSGFFGRTNEAVKTRQKSVGLMQHNDRSRDHQQEKGNSAIFRGGQVKKSAAEAFKPVIEEKRHTKPDLRVKSNDTDISDGVTLDPSIADVSILTDPTIHRTEESREEEHEPGAIPSPVQKPEFSSIQESEKLSPLASAEPRLQTRMHDQKDSTPSGNKSDIVRFENNATKNNIVTPITPSTPNESHYEDKGWVMTNARNLSQETRNSTSQGSIPLQGLGWPPVDSDDWIDFSPSRTKDERQAEPDKLTKNEWDPGNNSFSSNSFDNTKRLAHEPQRIPPRTPAIPVAENHRTNNYQKPSSTVSQESVSVSNAVRDNGTNINAFGSKTNSAPSPFDEDYSTLMDARHKMLLSRQRSHQEKKMARETARGVTSRREFPAEAPGLTMTDFDPMVTPFLDSSRRKQDVGGVRSTTFFSRTHPNSVPTTPPATQGYRTSSDYNSNKSLSPKDDGNRTRTSPHGETRNQDLKKTDEESALSQSDAQSSVFSRLSESTSPSDDASRQETLVARLHTVKAARIRRKTPTHHSGVSHVSQDSDLDQSETTIRAGMRTRNPVGAVPHRALDDQNAVVSSREAFERYMASSGPPPPPPPSPPPSVRPPASYRMSTRPVAVSKPLDTRDVKPSTAPGFDTNPFHHVPEPSPALQNGKFPSNPRRYATPPPPPPPPPPRYPNTSQRYRPATKPMVKYSNAMALDDELDRHSSSSSNSSSFFRETSLTLD